MAYQRIKNFSHREWMADVQHARHSLLWCPWAYHRKHINFLLWIKRWKKREDKPGCQNPSFLKINPCQLEGFIFYFQIKVSKCHTKKGNRFIPTEVIHLGHKRSLFCASSQVQAALFFLLPSSLSSSPLQVQTSSSTQKAISCGLPCCLWRHMKTTKNVVSVLNVFNILFCSDSRKRKILSYQRIIPWNECTPGGLWVRVSEGRTEPGMAAGTGQNPCRENNTLKRRAFQNNCIFRFQIKY